MKRRVVLIALAMFVLSSCEISFGFNNSNSLDDLSENTSMPTSPSEISSSLNSTITNPSSVESLSTAQDSTPEVPSEELGAELLKNTDFNSLDSWLVYSDATCGLSVNSNQNGTISLNVDNRMSEQNWMPQFLQNGIALEANHQYYVTFTIQSSVSRKVLFMLQEDTSYDPIPVRETIYLTANTPYTFKTKASVGLSSDYLFGFMLGRVEDQVIDEEHIVTISNPSLRETVTLGLNGTTTSAPATYKNRTLAWSDEFNGNIVDRSKWNYEIGNGSWGWGNNEQQYYTNSTNNSFVSNGSLKIVARKEQIGSSNYTSARMITKGRYSFKYGYIEARIALPSSMGIWPAFWMLGTNIDSVGWPLCGEIDIMEAINSENKVYSTVHYKNATEHEEYGQSYNISNRTSYHTYGFEWTDKVMMGYVDNIKIFETSNDGFKTQSFNNNFYILLNVAVGGRWPGFNIADNFPQVMSVDYVRVYQ